MTGGVQRLSHEEMDRLVPGWREDVRRVVDAAPPLTQRQREQLALLLRGSTGASDERT